MTGCGECSTDARRTQDPGRKGRCGLRRGPESRGERWRNQTRRGKTRGTLRVPRPEAYRKEVVRQMMERLRYKNPMAVPRLHKNRDQHGVGERTRKSRSGRRPGCSSGPISVKRPVMRRPRKSIANFKILRACRSADRDAARRTGCTTSFDRDGHHRPAARAGLPVCRRAPLTGAAITPMG